jgi:hypothetical protein
MRRWSSSPVFLVTTHSVRDRSRAPIRPPLSRSYRPARSRRAGPVVFRILPRKVQSESEA